MKISGFIDNVLVVASSNTKNTNIIPEKAYKNYLNWAEKSKLKFASKKHWLVYFKCKRNKNHFHSLVIAQDIITVKLYGKFLEVRFDIMIKWKKTN